MSDEPIDSSGFEALAYGVFSTADDTDTGRASLLDAYNSYTWSDDAAARKTLEYYGQALKFKNQDQSTYGDRIAELAPVKLADITPREDDSLQGLFTDWEQKNIEYLNKPDLEPEYTVARTQLLQDVKEYAARERRKANKQGLVSNIGETGAAVTDFFKRAGQGAVSGVEPIVNSVVNIFTDGYELNSHITEMTDPDKDGKFISDFAQGIGSATGALATGMVAGPAGVFGYATTQGIDAAGTRYQETMRKTGDVSKARKAGVIEAGSQALQILGEQLVFGKIARGAPKGEESILKETLKAGAIEATTEGTGQVISNVAENIQDNKPAFQNVGRGVAEAAGIAGLLAGGSTAGSRVIVGKANTNARKSEIVQEGLPITPVTKQVVGAIQPQENEDVIPSEDGFEFVPSETEAATTDVAGDSKEVRIIDPQSETPTQPIILPQGETAFKTEDGSEYIKSGEARYSKVGELSHDITFFLSEENAQKVAQAVQNGEQVTLNKDNLPVIERVGEDGQKYFEEIPASLTPAKDLFPLAVSEERSPSPTERVRPMALGQRIKEVATDVSVGAAGKTSVEQRESRLSQTLREERPSPNLAAIGDEGIFYDPFDNTESHRISGGILRGGVDNAIKAFNDPEFDQRVKNSLNTDLINYFIDQENKATVEGDTERLEKIIAYQRQNIPSLSATRTFQGQAFGALKGVKSSKVGTVYTQELNRQRAQIAREEGVTPQDVEQSLSSIAPTTRAIQNATKEVEVRAAQDADFVSPEHEAITTVVEDIENSAQEKLDNDLHNIERETEDLKSVVTTTEKKAARAKRKDIQSLEGAVAKDSEALTNALQDAAELKNVTTEEAAALEETINKAIDEAAKKASAEVTKAVKEERRLKEEGKKSILDAAAERLQKAQDAYNRKKKSVAEQLTKAKLRAKSLAAEGKSTDAIMERIAKLEKSITDAAQRVVDAEENIKEKQAFLEEQDRASQETEDLFRELEQGVDIQVRPVGRKRHISVRTKRTGMDITKLFRKSDAAGPLSILSNAVNNLAGVVQQSLGAKVVNNERIAELTKRINENKELLRRTRERETLTDAEKKRIAAAKKRLDELDKARKEATLESRIPEKTREKYRKYKESQKNIKKGRPSDSPELKAAKEKLRALEAQKARAERLAQKEANAKQQALLAAQAQSATEARIAELNNLLDNGNLTPSQERAIRKQITELEGVNERSPGVRYALSNMWAANQINGTVIGPLSLIAGTFGIVVNPLAFSVADIYDTIKNRTLGKLTGAAYVRGVLDTNTLARALALAKIALTTGQRLPNILKRKDIALADFNTKAISHELFTGEFYEYAKSLKFSDAETAAQKLYVAMAKATGYLTMPGLRILAASEALVYSVHHSGFDRAAAAQYYNQLKNRGVAYSDITTGEEGVRSPTDQELAQYMYEPAKNWEASLKYASDQADRLRAAGIKVTESQQYLDAVERYQSILPRQVQISAYKQAAQLVGNGPAQGILGVLSEAVNYLTEIAGGDKSPVKFLAMFANSIAQFTNDKLAWTPFGFVDSFVGRTDFEKRLIRAKAATGSIAGVAILSLLHAWKDEDGEPPFDIVSLDGGRTYTFKVGNTYINTADTPLALWAYGLGKARDKVRKGEDPDPVLSTIAMQSAFTAAAATVNGIQDSMQMLQGISNILDAFKAYDRGSQDASALLVRSLVSPVKGFIPGTSMLRTAARFFDNPVAARKDIMSAIVEGLPVLQSAYGLPSLNVFGEVMAAGKDDPDLNIHRIFSTKPSDVDIRWLVDNGYTTPTVSRMPLPKSVKDYANYLNEYGTAESVEADYKLKHQAFREAAPELRELVRQYRETYQYSAHNPDVQKSLNRAFNQIVAQHAISLLDR